MSDLFHDFTLNVLTKSLDANALNQVLIANNIANVDTPGFKRMEVSFKQQLRNLLDQSNALRGTITHPNDIPINGPTDVNDLAPMIRVDDETSMRTDQNNVDIDKEMAKLHENSESYQALSALMVSKLTELRIAITGQ